MTGKMQLKRGMFSDEERTLFKKVEQEHDLFMYRMLASPAEDIYSHCGKIRFYECVYEYFMYAEEIGRKHILACLKCSDIMRTLYEVYQEREYLDYSTFEKVRELLDVLAEDMEGCSRA